MVERSSKETNPKRDNKKESEIISDSKDYRLVYDVLRNKTIGVTSDGKIVSLKSLNEQNRIELLNDQEEVQFQEKHGISSEEPNKIDLGEQKEMLLQMRPVGDIAREALVRELTDQLMKGCRLVKEAKQNYTRRSEYLDSFTQDKANSCLKQVIGNMFSLVEEKKEIKEHIIESKVQKEEIKNNQESIQKQIDFGKTLGRVRSGIQIDPLREIYTILEYNKVKELENMQKVKEQISKNKSKNKEELENMRKVEEQIPKNKVSINDIEAKGEKTIKNLEKLQTEKIEKIKYLDTEIAQILDLKCHEQHLLAIRDTKINLISIIKEAKEFQEKSETEQRSKKDEILGKIHGNLVDLITLPGNVSRQRDIDYQILEDVNKRLRTGYPEESMKTGASLKGDQKQRNLIENAEKMGSYLQLKQKCLGDPAFLLEDVKKQVINLISRTDGTFRDITSSAEKFSEFWRKKTQDQFKALEAEYDNILLENGNALENADFLDILQENLLKRQKFIQERVNNEYEQKTLFNQKIIGQTNNWTIAALEGHMQLAALRENLEFARSFTEQGSAAKGERKSYLMYQKIYRWLLFNNLKLYDMLDKLNRKYTDWAPRFSNFEHARVCLLHQTTGLLKKQAEKINSDTGQTHATIQELIQISTQGPIKKTIDILKGIPPGFELIAIPRQTSSQENPRG